MPIYEYLCDACGHAFSTVRSFQDEALAACPQCGARPRKLMSSPALVFKGSGWYKTDSRAGSAAAKADAKAEGKADAAESKPAETKPDKAKPAEGKPAEAKPAAATAEPKP